MRALESLLSLASLFNASVVSGELELQFNNGNVCDVNSQVSAEWVLGVISGLIQPKAAGNRSGLWRARED
jgi:hypothetical protein